MTFIVDLAGLFDTLLCLFCKPLSPKFWFLFYVHTSDLFTFILDLV